MIELTNHTPYRLCYDEPVNPKDAHPERMRVEAKPKGGKMLIPDTIWKRMEKRRDIETMLNDGQHGGIQIRRVEDGDGGKISGMHWKQTLSIIDGIDDARELKALLDGEKRPAVARKLKARLLELKEMGKAAAAASGD